MATGTCFLRRRQDCIPSGPHSTPAHPRHRTVPRWPTWMSTLSPALREAVLPSSSSLEHPAWSSCSRSTLRRRPPPASCWRFSRYRARRSRRCCSRLALSPGSWAWAPASSPCSSNSSWAVSEGHEAG